MIAFSLDVIFIIYFRQSHPSHLLISFLTKSVLFSDQFTLNHLVSSTLFCLATSSLFASCCSSTKPTADGLLDVHHSRSRCRTFSVGLLLSSIGAWRGEGVGGCTHSHAWRSPRKEGGGSTRSSVDDECIDAPSKATASCLEEGRGLHTLVPDEIVSSTHWMKFSTRCNVHMLH